MKGRELQLGLIMPWVSERVTVDYWSERRVVAGEKLNHCLISHTVKIFGTTARQHGKGVQQSE